MKASSTLWTYLMAFAVNSVWLIRSHQPTKIHWTNQQNWKAADSMANDRAFFGTFIYVSVYVWYTLAPMLLIWNSDFKVKK